MARRALPTTGPRTYKKSRLAWVLLWEGAHLLGLHPPITMSLNVNPVGLDARATLTPQAGIGQPAPVPHASTAGPGAAEPAQPRRP